MHTDDLRRAYADFVTAARQRPPDNPASAWSPELILAHVIVGDRLIAEAAARVAAGAPTSFDNLASQSEPYLRAVADAAGTWDGLVAEVERTGNELIALVGTLTDEQAATSIASKVFSDGAVFLDRTVPLSSLVQVPSALHLGMHLQQLGASAGATAAAGTGASATPSPNTAAGTGASATPSANTAAGTGAPAAHAATA